MKLLSTVLSLLVLCAPEFSSPAADSILQGASLLKTDILGVFAHPDDETGMAATLAHCALGQARSVAVAYATRGEGGGNMVGTQSGPALGILRETELRECLRILGVRSCYFLDQEDFFYTESLDATLRKWRKDEALEKLVRIVRALRPEVIVTLNPAPNPGQHGHHQAAGVLATEAFSAAADPARFPGQLKEEGLAVWQARKLFFGGASGAHVTSIPTTAPLADGRIPADVAGEALAHHRSQAFGNFVRAPWLRRPQAFTLAKSAIRPEPDSTDLLAGLPAAAPVVLIEFARRPTKAPISFVPRPAIAGYQRWAAQYGLDHLAAEFPADLPVIAGEATQVSLRVPRGTQISSVQSMVSPRWKAGPWRRAETSTKEGPEEWTIAVEAPAEELADGEIIARTSLDGTDVSAQATLHPVPYARVPRLRHSPALEASTSEWQPACLLEIGTNRTWQGKSDGPADCSARVWIAHDQHHLYVRAEVLDDVVVSNIEPNDIKGHWRSDSIEICIDPDAGAPDTTRCFKLGVFPFDTTGQVRAARDADARQGPAEETAAGLQLASRRTATGYTVEAAIPLKLVTGQDLPPPRLGFNLLIYDGDKRDAAPGENINDCRLAWAPRSGVQGRPEDWGRIDLD